MGYVSGGPQVYTGRDMATSHKHLAISEEEWGSFMAGLHDVCSELGIPAQEVKDVAAVISSLEANCIVTDGEAVPANPGHLVPPGDALYARLGGVYPISLFCDRLVDALLTDTNVKIPVDETKRTMPSLKYLFTELVCSITGGPETMTAASLEETKLQLTALDFFKLLASVSASADHFESPALTAELGVKLHEAMVLIMKAPAAATEVAEKMRMSVAQIAADVKYPVLFVPDGNNGYLVAMEEGATKEVKERRRKKSEALGFEEMSPGLAKLPVPTDKDVLFLIDISGSMRGQRIENATNNALKIYDTFTDDNDAVGLAWFDHRYQLQIPLKQRAHNEYQRKQYLDDRRKIDKTRHAINGATAFYDALIEICKTKPQKSNHYLVALTDGADGSSKHTREEAKAAIAKSPWTLLVIGLQVNDRTRIACEELAAASTGGMYLHAADADAGLDAAFADVAANFAMPTVKSADASASGGGARGM